MHHANERENHVDADLDDLLDRLLRAEPRERSLLLDALCDAHPGEASSLRRRYQALDRIGMLDRDAKGPPTKIGTFTVLEQIGQGGMGVVYRAQQDNLGRDVAIKLLRPEFAWLSPSRQRFLREGRVVARLDHPAIVPILQFGEHDGQPFLVMRYIPGCSLADVLTEIDDLPVATRTGHAVVRGLERGAAPANHADDAGVDNVAVASTLHGLDTRWSRVIARLLLPIAEALGHAHQNGVVHRDIKPSNILISNDGHAHMCDFGLASLDHDEQLTRSGALLGSVPYMSPEQVDGQPTDARSDVFSFGSVLYEALCGRRPFGTSSTSETMHAISRIDPPSLTSGLPHVERDLMAIAARCLEKRSGHRYANGTELANDLRAFLNDRPVSARRLTYAQRTMRFARREPVRFVLATSTGILLLMLASLSGYLWAEQDALAAGHDTLRSERLERTLALGYHALVAEQNGAARTHFERCLQIDAGSTAARTGIWVLQAAPATTLTEPSRTASRATRFRRATQLMFAGPRGDNVGTEQAVTLLRDLVLAAEHARPIYHGMLATAAAAANHHELAARTADALEEIWPDSATACYWAGSARLAFDKEAAERSLGRAVQLDPTFAPAWAELGACRLLRDAHAHAVTALEKATELAPNNSKAWLDLGLAHQYSGNREIAERALRHATTLPDAVPGASYNLGVLLAPDAPEAAIVQFERTTALAPDYAEAWYNLGHLRTSRGELDLGHTALLQAVHLRPNWTDAWRQLGHNRATAADAEGTAAAYRRIVALDPADQAAKSYLQALLQHTKASNATSTAGSPTSTPRD